MTVVGVAVGALIAARQYGEFSLRPARQPVFHFLSGFLMLSFGLVLGSRPICIVVLGSYGSTMGLVG